MFVCLPMLIVFAHCCKSGDPCSYHFNDVAAQVVCMQAQGWRRSPSKTRNWCCLECRLRNFPLDVTLPSEDNLWQSCVVHLTQSRQMLRGNNACVGSSRTSSSQQMWPGKIAALSSLQTVSPQVVYQFPMHLLAPCEDTCCQASYCLCAGCQRVDAFFNDSLPVENELVFKVTAVVHRLNAIRSTELPRWMVHCGQQAAKNAQHTAVGLWDDCGNLAGSALLLMMLKPLSLGIRELPPLRIMGSPPPASLLQLDGPAPPRQPHDNYRTNVLEGLLGHFRATDNVVCGDLLQDCWFLIRGFVMTQSWEHVPAWVVARGALRTAQAQLVDGAVA